jgi:hypothetical protein
VSDFRRFSGDFFGDLETATDDLAGTLWSGAARDGWAQDLEISGSPRLARRVEREYLPVPA